MHISVMPVESLNYWIQRNEKGEVLPGIYVDATFGEGGHSALFLAQTKKTKNVFLIALDQDERRVTTGRKKFQAEIKAGKIEIIKANFKDLREVLSSFKIKKLPFQGILFDFGLCTTQFEEGRGFSFAEGDAPLDMRMDEKTELTAGTILNEWEENDLARMFKEKGDEPAGRKIARAILAERNEGLVLEKVSDFVDLLKRKVFKRYFGRIHFATKAFQALRITVNQEDWSLKRALEEAKELLNPGGRIVTIAFHSGEDRPVKNFFRQETKECICPPEMPICRCGHQPSLKVLTKKPLVPQPEEIAKNPNARSAKMRVAEKL